MINTFIIYGSGMLGQQLYNYLVQHNEELKHNWNIRFYSIDKVDITNSRDLKDTIIPESYVINCAAYTNVDKAESEQDLAYAVNADAVKTMAKICKERKCKLVHISSDFVYGSNNFDILNEHSILDPVNVYGASKLEGEENVRNYLPATDYLILRIAWTFGIYGNNFIRKIYEQLINPDIKDLNVVDDQTGRPTSIALVVQMIYLYITQRIPSGIYNLTCSGNYCTKYDIAMYIKKIINSNKQINKKLTKDYAGPGVADRQLNSRLDCKKAFDILSLHFNIEDYDWHTEVKKYIEQLKELNKE